MKSTDNQLKYSEMMNSKLIYGVMAATAAFSGSVSVDASAADMAEKSINEYMTLGIPSSLEANRANTHTNFGQTGLGICVFGLTERGMTVRSCEGYVTIGFSAEKDGEPEILRSLKPGNSAGGIMIMGATPFDNGDFSNNPALYTLYMFFASNPDAESGLALDSQLLPLYRQTGYYTVTIPDGAFALADGTLIPGAKIQFHYSDAQAPHNFNYTLSPAAGEEKQYPSAADLFAPSSGGITVTFAGTRQVDYLRNVQLSKLTLPDGTELSGNVPTGGGNRAYLTFTFGSRSQDWSQAGQYEFEVLPNVIGLDQGEYDEWELDGTVPNFPGLKATYIVEDDMTNGVLLYGVDKADSYTVHSLDGRQIMQNASPARMADLDGGVYIVNGKVVNIVK